MDNKSYARSLLAVGVIGLTVTCFMATSANAPATASAEPTSATTEKAVSVGQPVAPAPVVEIAAIPAPAPYAVHSAVVNAGRVAACQAEFDKLVQENPIDFQRDRTELSDKGKTTIGKLVVVVRACSGLKIEIQGHTDGTGIRQNNIQLSLRRADAVKQYLVELGLSPDRLTAVGFGPDHPAASNRTPSDRARNRRIEFRVSRLESE
ncbi:MAG: OmpA family protein [Hyphomonadaceae bacterium]